MSTTPKWFMPVAIVALLWNAAGCAAYLADVTMSADDLAKLDQGQQALYAARPAWAVAAFAVAVWGGAAGSLGLVLRKAWAQPLLWLSLAGLLIQDAALFGLTSVVSQSGPSVLVIQGLVCAVAVGLVLLARHAARQRWLA